MPFAAIVVRHTALCDYLLCHQFVMYFPVRSAVFGTLPIVWVWHRDWLTSRSVTGPGNLLQLGIMCITHENYLHTGGPIQNKWHYSYLYSNPWVLCTKWENAKILDFLTYWYKVCEYNLFLMLLWVLFVFITVVYKGFELSWLSKQSTIFVMLNRT